MTKQEILEQVAKLEKGLTNPNIPESAKGTLKKKLEDLQSKLKEEEKKIEIKEDKAELKEEKAQSELEATIAKLEKGLSNPNIPASAKESIKKKIEAAKEELKKQKEELKEDKKEADKEKKELKKVSKKIEEVAKKARKTPIKGTKKKEVKAEDVKKAKSADKKSKKREVKSKKRESKIKKILTDLESIINKNKFLKAKYDGKDVNLKKDAGRSAKPFGYRFIGKHDYRVPTAAQVKAGLKRGTIDYEARPNRSDKYPTKSVKLAKGGDVQGKTTSKKQDGERFAKPAGARWKEKAVKKGVISRASLSKSPSKAMREKYPNLVYTENRTDKSDKNPSRKYISLGKGGDVQGKTTSKKQDGERFAKPAGARWKDKAVKKGVISKAGLSKSPSKAMREKYPTLVYTENRTDKSDKKPSRKYISL